MQKVYYYIVLRKEEDWLEVYHYGRVMCIHADMALTTKDRVA